MKPLADLLPLVEQVRASNGAFVDGLRGFLEGRPGHYSGLIGAEYASFATGLSSADEVLRREPPDWEALDRLLDTSPYAETQRGILLALGAAWLRGSDAGAAVGRLVAALSHRDATVREQALAILQRAAVDARQLPALSPERLKALIDASALAGPEPEGSEPAASSFLHGFLTQGQERAAQVAGLLDPQALSENEGLAHLARVCQEVIDGRYPPCRTCDTPTTDALERVSPKARIHRCPACCTYFEDVEHSEGPEYVSYDYWTLNRLSPFWLQWHVRSGRIDRKQLDDDLPRVLAQLRAELHHLFAGRRRWAMESLADHYRGGLAGDAGLTKSGIEALCEALLDPPDEAVRLATLDWLPPLFRSGAQRRGDAVAIVTPRLLLLAQQASPPVARRANDLLGSAGVTAIE